MIFLYIAGALAMIASPLVLATWLARRRQADWGLFGIGAAMFIFSQLLHIPFNLLVDQMGFLPVDLAEVANLAGLSMVLGLSAGVFEEVSRYLGFRFLARDARHWRAGLMLGAGHGGIEAMVLGLLALVNGVALFGISAGHFVGLVPPEQMPLVQAQVHALRDAAWYDALLPLAERLFALSAHLALSLLVMESVIRKRRRWLLAAVMWHALLDAVALFSATRWNVYVAEGAIAVFAVASLAIIIRLRHRELAPEQIEVEQRSPTESREAARPGRAELDAEKLERSRFF